MLQAILFDLDGTLLPMDNDHFTAVYFRYLAKKAALWGYDDPKALIKALWIGVEAMVKNQGTQSNFDAFWDAFGAVLGKDAKPDAPKFDSFYANEFNLAKDATGEAPLAVEAVKLAHEKARHVILATNPIFPTVADVTRLDWIGLKMEDFDLVTDYTNSCFSKPNPAYYQTILDQFGLDPAQCLMVGNNVKEDWQAAAAVGIPCFLLTDNLINPDDTPLTCPHGSYEEMVEYLRAL